MRNIDSILVATDLAETSDEIVRAAAALAKLTGAKLHLLHAFDLELSPYPGLDGSPSFQGRVDAAERALAEQIRRTVPPGVPVTSCEVEMYSAHRAIVEHARAVGADLIVLGPHRGRTLGTAFLGGTADRVIRTAEVPCLVISGPLSVPLRRILAPLDLSKPALGALDVALAWASSLGPEGGDPLGGPELTVLHVIPRVFDMDDFPFDRAVIGPELHAMVEDALGRVSGAGALAVREVVRWGDTPAEEIIRSAREERADLVVLATHGYGAVRRALIGSVASGVARGASCPVLLVPPSLWRGD